MYKRNAQGWSKHFDFMIVDEISLQIAFQRKFIQPFLLLRTFQKKLSRI